MMSTLPTLCVCVKLECDNNFCFSKIDSLADHLGEKVAIYEHEILPNTIP